ncbi:MAG: endolytic transglycosylase MltG [bacterium]|nr:endolytic transglycosylase MltG [bacterium]
MKKLLKILIILAALGFFFYQFSLRPLDASSDARHSIKIESGLSVKHIANLLQEKDILRSPWAFVLYVRLKGDEASLQAGKFVLLPSMSAKEIVEILHTGKADEAIITIPEGFNVHQIDALMVEKGFIEEGEIIDCVKTCNFSFFEFLPPDKGLAERGGIVEGYLYPDTYYVTKDDFEPKFFIERLLTTFRKRVIETHGEEITKSGRELHELLTMASLIEEETRTDAERAMVSGILWKRYDDGRGLGVDATVRYILDKPTDRITTSDLNVNSPYNTRKFKGLPPGPIASPGLDSIMAALRPRDSKYWYYLHGDDGLIRYAESNEEHNINRYNYIK